METKFTTSKMNVVKEMMNILECTCEARLKDGFSHTGINGSCYYQKYGKQIVLE